MSKYSYSTQEVKQVWEQAQRDLKLQLTPAAYHTWILTNPLTALEDVDQNKTTGIISTPSAFHATNLKKNLYTQLKQALEKATNKKIQLEFRVQDPTAFTTQSPNRESGQTNQPNSSHSPSNSPFDSANIGSDSDLDNLPNSDGSNFFKSSQKDNTQSPSVNDLFSQQNIQSVSQDRYLTAAKRSGLRLDYKFKTFAVSGSNEMAHAAAQAVSKRPGQAYNPLFLYGGVGVGKTHLMQAIGHSILEKEPSSNVIYCTGEEFTNEIIDAIRSKKAIKFKRKFRTAQILLIDDIQFIAGKNTVQEEFFHTFNALIKMSSQIILTSDRPPHEINLLEDRLRSRFEAGLMVDIQQPSLELRTAIVLIKGQANNLALPLNIAEIIAQSVDSARKIEGIITSLRSAVELRNLEITEDLINTILAKEKKNSSERLRLKPQEIIKKVCDYYQLNQTTVRGKKRNKEFVQARHLAMFLLKEELDLSYVEIGKWFSNRDHTSVMHAKNKIDDLLKTDISVQEDYNKIRNSLIKIAH